MTPRKSTSPRVVLAVLAAYSLAMGSLLWIMAVY